MPGDQRWQSVAHSCVDTATAACMLTRKEAFEQAGGFDAKNLPVVLNDADLCLRLREKGYLVVFTPYAVLYHTESASRGDGRDPREIAYMKTRWKAVLKCDPYSNPNLTLDAKDFSLRP